MLKMLAAFEAGVDGFPLVVDVKEVDDEADEDDDEDEDDDVGCSRRI